MKKLLLFGALVLSINVFGQESFKIGNLEVMTEDLGAMNWDDATKACADLGDGWRLPTKEELNVLYENMEKIGGFVANYYWSSKENEEIWAWKQDFDGGDQGITVKRTRYYVRAVRMAGNSSIENVDSIDVDVNSSETFTNEVVTGEAVTDEVVVGEPRDGFVKVGKLEVMTEDLGELSWNDATKACADLGDGWRLPTKEELNVLYENKDEIGGFVQGSYWSSTEDGYDAATKQLFFHNGSQSNFRKYTSLNVRAVRSL